RSTRPAPRIRRGDPWPSRDLRRTRVPHRWHGLSVFRADNTAQTRGNRVRWITSVNARTAVAPPKTADAGLQMHTPWMPPSDDTAGPAPPRALHRQDTAGPAAGSDRTSFIPRPLIVQVVVCVEEQRCVR